MHITIVKGEFETSSSTSSNNIISLTGAVCYKYIIIIFHVLLLSDTFGSYFTLICIRKMTSNMLIIIIIL